MRKFFGLLLLISFIAPVFGKEYALSIAAIFRDEAPYLREWIEYHRVVGVEHFYLYNNNSQDNFKEVLEPYIQRKIVTLKEWPSVDPEKNRFKNFCYVVQPGAYNHALKRAKKTSDWLAVIDIDEFLVPITGSTIPELLNDEFFSQAGVMVNWLCFGTSHLTVPEGVPMIEALTRCSVADFSMNRMGKSIVRPECVSKFQNPHYCVYNRPFFHVNTDSEPISKNDQKILLDKLRINHYWTRDEKAMYELKIPRYENYGANNYVLKVNEHLNEAEDFEIHRFLEKLKKAL